MSAGGRPRLQAALAALALLALGAGEAPAADRVDALVESVRPERVYVRVRRPLDVGPGDRVRLVTRAGDAEDLRVQAASTDYLALDPPESLALTPRQRLFAEGTLRREEEPPPSAAEGPRSPVQVGRPQPTLRDYQADGVPELEKVPFRNRVRGVEGDDEGEGEGEGGDGAGGAPADRGGPGPAEPVTRPDDRALVANEVRGEITVGADGAYDEDADIERVTPYTRLRLEVRNLGGSDRARLFFYGTLRQPFDDTDDWTGHGEDQLVGRISAAVLEVDALAEGQVEGFSDRLELRLGRSTVPGVVQAGIVDGVQLGVRAGPAIAFAFAGAPVSPDPQREDYDGIIYGGGVRIAKSFTHAGAFRLSLAAAQERFRGEGERDFIEARADVRYGKVGVRGAAVVDLFSVYLDRENTRLTTGLLSAYVQATGDVRLDGGYRLTRPTYTAELLDPERLGRGSDLDPVVFPFLQREERQSLWAGVSLRLPTRVDLLVRADYLWGRDTRDVLGLRVGVGKRDVISTDRIRLDAAVHRRSSADGVEDSTDPYVSLTYSWFGDVVMVDASVYYRTSIPSTRFGDSRIGGRLSFDAQLDSGLGFRAYGAFELRRDTESPGELILAGLSVRYRF